MLKGCSEILAEERDDSSRSSILGAFSLYAPFVDSSLAPTQFKQRCLQRRNSSSVPAQILVTPLASGSSPVLYKYLALSVCSVPHVTCIILLQPSTFAAPGRLSPLRISFRHSFKNASSEFCQIRVGYRKRSALEIHHIDHSGLTADRHWILCTTPGFCLGFSEGIVGHHFQDSSISSWAGVKET